MAYRLLQNFMTVPNLTKIPKHIRCLGSSLPYRSFRRKFMQQVWKDKTNEIIKNQGEIFLIEQENGWEKVSSIICRDITTVNAVGFDCEWAHNFSTSRRKPVALLQLATYSGNCVLFRLNNFQKIPSSLKDILEDKNILKVGVACDIDASNFAEDHNIEVRGWLDLRHLATQDGLKNRKLGLQSLAKHYLDKTMLKNWKGRASNWEKNNLSPEQVTYAAEDAIVGIRILLLQLKNLWTPVLEESWETSISKAVKEVCEPYVEVNYGPDKEFCFVCGNYPTIKKSVVLEEYRKYYPKILQSLEGNRGSVSLCSQCHEIITIKDNELKQKLAEECSAPVESNFRELMIKRREALLVCRFLMKERNKLSPEKIRNLEAKLKDYFQSNILTGDLRTEESDLETQIANEDRYLHGYKVFKYYEKIGLIHLTTRWKEWFMDSMKPKYLPESWYMSHNEYFSFLESKICSLDSESLVGLKSGLFGTKGETNVDSDNTERNPTVHSSNSDPDLNGEDSLQNFASERSIEQDYIKR